ncbi:hypothetical protein [Thermococcus sp.]|uniref:hypothetical protein n=1 Tax=Thermococcus sp. TaxID=35749 RepID=UPI0025FF0C1A|nr:hypothetical protein [Thermococcus sp.]
MPEKKNLDEYMAFGYWFLEEVEDLSEEDAELTILDGPWDQGRDAVYFDEENEILKIYQFKYSTEPSYVLSAFKDIQRAIQAEHNLDTSPIHRAKMLRLYVVTLADANEKVREEYKKTRKRIRTWLTKHGYNLDADIEIFDLKNLLKCLKKYTG